MQDSGGPQNTRGPQELKEQEREKGKKYLRGRQGPVIWPTWKKLCPVLKGSPSHLYHIPTDSQKFHWKRCPSLVGSLGPLGTVIIRVSWIPLGQKGDRGCSTTAPFPKPSAYFLLAKHKPGSSITICSMPSSLRKVSEGTESPPALDTTSREKRRGRY